MKWSCKCGWSSRGGMDDMLGHLRGKHSVDARLGTSSPTERRRKWMPHHDNDNASISFAQCNSCMVSGRGKVSFDDKHALLEHLNNVHAVDIHHHQDKIRKR
eukprot:TRINITY_DN3226_c0_g3_i1.p1 TRINITY_DN3226_c0_g3~~TRINITY_DN3226_c0_g3_i1.p1  ORF type:complete len:102 (-),score=5.76 TRINITY_DN3226_c0_g3_i1:141-446(-)